MSSFYIRGEDEIVQGPYAREAILDWIAEGRLDDRIQYSIDAMTWRYARDVPDLGGATPSNVGPGGFPEPSLLIRQGASIQGPYRLSRIRGYVHQRRIQHYMLFSEDGVWWVGPEHVPGLLPDGYVPLPPPRRPTAVPADGQAPDEETGVRMPKHTKPPAPGEDIGSSTLVGFSLDENQDAPLSPPPPARAPVVAPVKAPLREEAISAAPVLLTYYVRTNGHDVYGPCAEHVLHNWIEEGRVDASAEFSNDGQTWTPGTRMVSLFPGAVPRHIPQQGADGGPPSSAPARRRFRGRR